MYDFVTALEFLTRVRFSHRTTWKADEFSCSVPYFPIIGLIIGVFLGAVNYGLAYYDTPTMLRASLLIFAEIFITGGLMYDGYMDTADGVFSARTRERMLEIMKDSNVGANAALAIIVLILLKVSAYLAIPAEELTYVLVAMSVVTRTIMAGNVLLAPNARKEGIGMLFKEYAKPSYIYCAVITALAILAYLGMGYIYLGAITLVGSIIIAKYLIGALGGLTGDTYGAITECGNVIYLIAAVYYFK